MAGVALALALILVGCLVLLWLERRRQGGLDQAERDQYRLLFEQQEDRWKRMLEVAHDELHKALDRLQAPEWAVQDSQAERAVKAGVVDPGVTGAIQEVPMSEEMRQRQASIEEELYEKLQKRGIDPSELQSASAEFRGGDLLDGS